MIGTWSSFLQVGLAAGLWTRPPVGNRRVLEKVHLAVVTNWVRVTNPKRLCRTHQCDVRIEATHGVVHKDHITFGGFVARMNLDTLIRNPKKDVLNSTVFRIHDQRFVKQRDRAANF